MRVSLLDGWFPEALRIATAIVVLLAAGWRNRRWRTRWLPFVAATAVTGRSRSGSACQPRWRWPIRFQPRRGSGWRCCCSRRSCSSSAGAAAGGGDVDLRRLPSPLTTVTLANAVNAEIGYYPTLRDAWLSISHAPMPAVVDLSQLGTVSPVTPTGRLVAVTIPASASHFRHRQEFVYLPAGVVPPALDHTCQSSSSSGVCSPHRTTGSEQDMRCKPPTRTRRSTTGSHRFWCSPTPPAT